MEKYTLMSYCRPSYPWYCYQEGNIVGYLWSAPFKKEYVDMIQHVQTSTISPTRMDLLHLSQLCMTYTLIIFRNLTSQFYFIFIFISIQETCAQENKFPCSHVCADGRGMASSCHIYPNHVRQTWVRPHSIDFKCMDACRLSSFLGWERVSWSMVSSGQKKKRSRPLIDYS